METTKKTLSRKVTATFFKPNPLLDSEALYDRFSRWWSAITNDKQVNKSLTATHFLLAAVLRGKNWQKGFVQVTNRTKLENGMLPSFSANRALRILNSAYCEASVLAPFGGIVDHEMLEQVRLVLAKSGYYDNVLKKHPYDLDVIERIENAVELIEVTI